MDSNHPLRPWFSLLRLPNLLTVPGDPIAGFLLAGGAAGRLPGLAAVCLAACFLYAFGLIQNDLADLATDKKERPGRPIASGAVSLRAAFAAMAATGFAGTGLALWADLRALAAALCLFSLICAYNLWAKRHPVRGPLFLGSCRAASLLMGAALGAAPFSAPLLPAALSLGAYIFLVSLIARTETSEEASYPGRFLPGLALAAGLAAVYLAAEPVGAARVFFIAFGLAAAGNALATGVRLSPPVRPLTVQQSIGRFLRGLLLLQAALASLSGPPGILLGICLTGLLFPASRLAKSFAPS